MDAVSVRPKFSAQKNPLELTPIIKCVLQFLNVADLKNCRHISKEWSAKGLLELKSRSKIVFNDRKTPAQFYDDFSDTLSIPFTAFDFNGKWKLTELNNFVQSNKNILHKLYLSNVHLYDDTNEKIEGFDITPFISDSPMTRLNTKPSTKLSVYSFVDTQIVVPLSSLINVKILELDTCQLILADKINPSPVELTLTSIKFIKDGYTVTDVCINDIFDFSRSKKIKISAMDLDLSLNYTLTLDYLCLEYGTNIKNWSSCKWSIKRLKLYKVPFIEKTEMQIKELDFCGSKIDVYCLPESLETLAVNVEVENEFLFSQSVNLPLLKSLRLNVKKSRLSNIISPFVHSPIENLDLSGYYSYYLCKINFDSIPNTVKKLKLSDVMVKIHKGDSPLNLDKLVLADCSYKELRILTRSHFKTKELVIVVNTYFGIPVDAYLLRFILFDKKCLDRNQRFYIGPLRWSHPFENSPLFQYVDKKAEYYVFEDSMGKAIDSREFKELETDNSY